MTTLINNDTIEHAHASSTIKKSMYNHISKELTLEFTNSSIYIYENVDAQTFSDFIQSSSSGKYFASHIKNNFNYRKI